MSSLVLELNDTGITLAREGKLLAIQPGYVLRDGQRIVLGEEAMHQAREHPQSVSNRYWDTLDQQTLPSEGRWRETPAELAYLQLVDLWSAHGAGAQGLALIVPPTFTRSQLGLILGMCRKADIQVVSMIDSAVAALNTVPPARQLVVVDLTLHRIAATRVTVDGRLRRAATVEIDQLGLSDFRRKWAAAVGDLCVRTTRYDPMHSAAAEQALYDELPGLLTKLQSADSAEFGVEIAGEKREVSVPKSALAKVCEVLHVQVDGLIGELVDPAAGEARVLLTHRFAQCPGAVQALGEAYGGASLLPPHAAVLGVCEHPELFAQDGDAIGLLTERPLPQAATVSAPTAAPQAATPPSHILVDNRVYVVSDMPFVVGTATREGSWGYRAVGALKGVSRRHCSIMRDGARTVVRDHSTFGTFVNGQRVDGEKTVGDGDVVRVGNPGVELRLLREASPDG